MWMNLIRLRQIGALKNNIDNGMEWIQSQKVAQDLVK